MAILYNLKTNKSPTMLLFSWRLFNRIAVCGVSLAQKVSCSATTRITIAAHLTFLFMYNSKKIQNKLIFNETKEKETSIDYKVANTKLCLEKSKFCSHY